MAELPEGIEKWTPEQIVTYAKAQRESRLAKEKAEARRTKSKAKRRQQSRKTPASTYQRPKLKKRKKWTPYERVVAVCLVIFIICFVIDFWSLVASVAILIGIMMLVVAGIRNLWK